MPSTLLQLSGITKCFGEVRALRGVSFDLQAGEVHALLGENGAGKSTLIKIITGAHLPDGGSITLNGNLLGPLNPAFARTLGIACIYQQPALFKDLTVAENIGLRLEARGAFKKVDWVGQRKQAETLLQLIGADIHPDEEVKELSMPEQQMVEIACALGAKARIIIMDEPTASLTRKEQELLFKVVRKLRTDGMGIIYISHRLEEIFALSDRVTVLRDGESVGTVRAGAVGEKGLIQRMVGRELAASSIQKNFTPGAIVLELRNLTCKENGTKNVSLEVRAGEVVGMAGMVGAGRTELAQILFGLATPGGGTILVNGKPTEIKSPSDAVKCGIAYVPEDRRRHGVMLEMAIQSNISMASHGRLFPGGWLHEGRENEEALRSIRELGIKTSGPLALANTLSGGNQQKVALGRWLATKPRVLILDEPTQGVDVGAKLEIHKIIRELAASGMAILMISSDLPEVIAVSDRIAVMRLGELVAMLPADATQQEIMAAALGQSVL
ncbi:MAG: rbsA 2 [Verrucomicrobiales bacterium]|nr:rbsA 2 [Verrucomicrobiales bacterium]